MHPAQEAHSKFSIRTAFNELEGQNSGGPFFLEYLDGLGYDSFIRQKVEKIRESCISRISPGFYT